MQSGRLRERAEIFAPSSYKAPDGSIESKEVSLGTFWCALKDFTRNEKSEQDQMLSYVRYRIHFRYQPTLQDIPPNARIVLNGRTNIIVQSSTIKGQRDRVLEVLGEERR